MVHKHKSIIWVVFVLVFAGIGVRPASADVPVEQFTLAHQGVFTEMAIHVPGRLLCNHFIVEPKFGKPFRVVLDLCGTVHQLGKKNFEDMPRGVISRVRTSQYATTPQNVVRLVLDLTREVSYKVSIDDQTIKISLVTPGEPEFGPWSSTPGKRKPVLASESAALDRDKAPPASEVAKISPPVKAEQTAIVAEVKKPKLHITKHAGSALAENVPMATPGEPTSEPKSQRSPKWTYAPYEEASFIKEAPVAQALSPQTTPFKETEEHLVSDAARQDLQSRAKREEPVVAADSMPVMAHENSEMETPVVAAQETEEVPLLTRLKQKFSGSAAEEQVTPDVSNDSAAQARIRALAKVTAETDVQDEGEAEEEPTEVAPRSIDRAELESKIASVIQSAAEPGSAMAASEAETGTERTSEKFAGKGAPVSVEPSRKKVKYERAGRRDPFNALIEGQRSGLWTTALPRVESLRLVGILEDYDGAIALFEDMEGYGYILQEGDPVKNGHVKVVGENRVLFQVDDYGWVHTVVLELRQDASSLNYDYAEESEDE